MRFRSLLLPILLALPAPVLASEVCHDLWFTRNAIMDRAGYCFGSVLGQAVFDNGDCRGKSVSLSPADSDRVARVQAAETYFSCKVATGSARLDLEDLAIRRRLGTLPVRDEFPGACLGWTGPIVPLRADKSAAAAVLAMVQPGDHVRLFHVPEDGWTYVTVARPGGPVTGGGWFDLGFSLDNCADFAG